MVNPLTSVILITNEAAVFIMDTSPKFILLFFKCFSTSVNKRPSRVIPLTLPVGKWALLWDKIPHDRINYVRPKRVIAPIALPLQNVRIWRKKGLKIINFI